MSVLFRQQAAVVLFNCKRTILFNALSVGFKLRPFDLSFFQFNFKDVQTVDRRIVEPSTLGGSTGPGKKASTFLLFGENI